MASRAKKRPPSARRVPPSASAFAEAPADKSARTTSDFRSLLLLFPLLLIVTVVAYHPVWHGGVLWDDDGHLTSAALRAPGGLGRIWFEMGATQQYYPLVHSAFWVMDRLWGQSTLGYHLVNIALHATSAWLLAIILRRLAVPGAWIAAVIFALHPVHVESVAWMTELKNTLSGVLYLSAALLYLSFDQRRTTRLYAGAIVLFVLALLSKTVTASLPAGLLVVFWWQRGKIDRRRDVMPLVPFFALGLVSGLLTAWVERTYIGAIGSAYALTPVDRVLVAGRALLFYLYKLVWPANLIFIYPRWDVGAAWWHYLFPVAALAITFVLWRIRNWSRAPLAAWLFFALTLSPALGFINIFPFRYSFVADHFQYLASIGIITLIAAGLATWIARRSSRALPLEAAACALIALPLGALTMHQSRDYTNAPTLYRATLAKNPECWMAYNNLAAIALALSPPDLESALRDVQTSLRLNPANEVAHNNYGVILQRQGRHEEALREHQEAIRLQVNYADAISNLGVDLAALGRTDEALGAYREAIRVKPLSAGAHQNLGLAYQDMGRMDDAIAEAREAIRLDPNYVDAYDSLGTALQRSGRFDEAATAYREAVRLQPSHGQAHNNLGSALLKMNRLDEAAAAFEDAIRLLPGAGLPHDNLGRVRLQQGRKAEALVEFQAAVQLQPTYAPAHLHLAESLDDAGQLTEAMAEYRATLALAPDSAEAHNNLGVVLARSGRLPEAITHFEEAVRIDPSFTQARTNLARARGGR